MHISSGLVFYRHFHFSSRASKGFSNQQTMQACSCELVFVELLQMFIQAVNVPVHRQLVQIGVRQYMHRMVVCMEREILPFVPVVLENLLKQPDARELHDFIPLMNQLIMKFKVRQGELLSVKNNTFYLFWNLSYMMWWIFHM